VNKKSTGEPLSKTKFETIHENEEGELVLDEQGTTYAEVIRRIEAMDASKDDPEEYEEVNLSSIEIPDRFISGGLAEAEVYHDFEDDKAEEEYLKTKLEREDIVLPDDETVQVNNISEKENIQFFASPRAQIDGGAKSSVTNILEYLHDVKWFNDKFKCRVYMRGATSKKLIVPKAIGMLRVRANTQTGWLDCPCYYSPNFTSTLLSKVDVRKATGFQ